MTQRLTESGSEAAQAEVIPFSVGRFWDVNECRPPCCPRALLIQTTDDQFLYLESWTVLPPANELGRNCVAHRALALKTLLALETTGQVIAAEPESVRDALGDFEAGECEWVGRSELPVAFRESADR